MENGSARTSGCESGKIRASAFAKRLPFERYFRDARAGMVMGIAHDIAVLNIARSMFPKPKGA